MESENDIQPVSYIKSNVAAVLKQVNERGNPVYITQNGKAAGVLISPKKYDELMNTLGMLKIIALGEKDISEGKTISHPDLNEKINRKFSG